MDSSIKPFNSDKASFGRHETFGLRYSWLTKGFQAFVNDHAIFTDPDRAIIELGVGKNMVNAIRYWLRAMQIISDTETGLIDTPLGTELFSEHGWDPYLEDEATLWLLHWLLATNSELATAWYWFFNCFHKAEFTGADAADALAAFVSVQCRGKHSEKTVRHEIAMILRMYCPSRLRAGSDIEDSLDAPLTSLQLITSAADRHYYHSWHDQRPNLPLGVIGFAVNEIFNVHGAVSLPIATLMYGDKYGIALGSVFRLTESALLAKLERLVQAYPAVFQINETAGVHQLFRNGPAIDSLAFLHGHYAGAASPPALTLAEGSL